MSIIVLIKLINCVVDVEHIELSKILLILDNAPCHQATKVIDYLDESKIQYPLLPQEYAPELAPVELFFANIKQKVVGFDPHLLT